MADIKVTPELVKDLDSLLNNFGMFMSLNLVHADQGLSRDAQLKVQELIQYSSRNHKNTSVLKSPVNNHMNENIIIVSQNLSTLISFMYDYLNYAKPIVTKLLNSRLERIESLENEYTKFMNKYFP